MLLSFRNVLTFEAATGVEGDALDTLRAVLCVVLEA